MVMRLALLIAALAPAAARAEPLDCAKLLLPPPGSAAPASRTVAAADLIELRDFGAPGDSPSGEAAFALSPDGRWIALAVRRAVIASNGYCYGVLLVPVGGGTPRLIDIGGEPLIAMTDYLGMADKPNGQVISSRLVWSPDGRWVAYLRRDDGVTQLWRVGVDGAGAARLTDEAVDVRRFAWSKDGASLRFQIRPGIARAAEAAQEEGKRGYLFDRRFWPVTSTGPLPLSSTPYEWRAIDVATRRTIEVPGPEPEVPPPVTGALSVAEGPGGATAWTGASDPGAYLGLTRLTARLRGGDVRCEASACPDRVAGMWWEGPDTLLYLSDRGVERGGTVGLYRWKPGTGARRLVMETDALLFGCAHLGGELLCARETASQPRHIVSISTATGAIKTVFDPNPQWAALRLGVVRRLPIAVSGGGSTFADLVLPPTHVAGERHPLVVVQYQSRGFLRGGTGDEYPVQLLAARGFAVLSFQRPNFFAAGAHVADGNAFMRRNVEGWADRKRVAAALDAAIARSVALGLVDPERVGITGLSDGANTTAYALSNGGRFGAAVLSTCCDDPSISGFASGPDYSANVQAWGYPAYGVEAPDFWARYSIARNAARIRTPLLIQAADREYRLALETVAALTAAGTPVEMFVFPDEYHIKWQPLHRDAVYGRTVDWFAFWLMGQIDPAAGKEEQYRRWTRMRSPGERPF